MSFRHTCLAIAAGTALLPCAGIAEQFVIELESPLTGDTTALMRNLKVTEIERFESPGRVFLILDARDEAAIEAFFNALSVRPVQIHEVDFVNSPVVGGGQQAGARPKSGHQVFLIERPIPGVGDFPIEKKQKISMGSNKAISQMGGSVEWEHSYLTDVGTFCIYRAEDSDGIRKHGELAGAPIKTVTAVKQVKSNP